MLPMSRCHREQRLPRLICHHVHMLPTAWCLCVPSCPYQCVIVCLCCQPWAKGGYCKIPPCTHVPHHLWPACAHRLYPYCPSVVPILCKVANVNVPIVCQCQCAQNVPIVCQSFPSQGVPRLQKLPMSWYLCRPSCPCLCTPRVPKFSTTWCLCGLSCPRL